MVELPPMKVSLFTFRSVHEYSKVYDNITRLYFSISCPATAFSKCIVTADNSTLRIAYRFISNL